MILRVENVKEEFRSGIGYDVHQFRDLEKEESRFIRIVGIDIAHSEDFNKKIKAHSDGDVAIHALIDAIFGAIGEGDIGEHFPETDEKWKNCDSTEMLKYANHLMHKKGAKLINADLTIICEKPRISKYKTKIEEKLAEVLNVNKNRINVKATTTEKMGFLGRQEGIAAQAICNISIIILE
jgi:2-C-methyl-D-erythritol 4-phosphate cytidylyltransferase/2-C-methyl-D-erythritol 2,4-cyclodiphosphate synthase